MTVGELERRMTAREFLEWADFYRHRDDPAPPPSFEDNPDAFLAGMGVNRNG